MGYNDVAHRFAAQFDRPPWRWVIPVAALQIIPIALLALALTHPIPGGGRSCTEPASTSLAQQVDVAATNQLGRDWAHAMDVRHELYDAACLIALSAVAVSALGGFVRRHRLVRYQFGLAVLCLVVVLFSAHAVDPVYYFAGC